MNISSKALAFRTEGPICPDMRLRVFVAWPVKLDECKLRLVFEGGRLASTRRFSGCYHREPAIPYCREGHRCCPPGDWRRCQRHRCQHLRLGKCLLTQRRRHQRQPNTHNWQRIGEGVFAGRPPKAWVGILRYGPGLSLPLGSRGSSVGARYWPSSPQLAWNRVPPARKRKLRSELSPRRGNVLFCKVEMS